MTQPRIYDLNDLYEQRFSPISTLDLSRVSATIEAYAKDLAMKVDEMLNEFSEEQVLSRSVWGGAPKMAFDEVNEFGRGKPRADVKGQEVHFPLFKLSATQEASEEFWKRAKVKDVIDLTQSMDIGYSSRIQDEVKAAIFNPLVHTKVKDWLVDNSSLDKIQPFLNGDSASIPDAPNGKTFAAGTQNHYIGITGSALAVADVDYLVGHVTEHGAGQICLYVDPSMPSTLAGLSNTKFVAVQPVVYADQRAAVVARAQYDPSGDMDNMLAGFWNGHEVRSRSWVPTGYINCMNISGMLGKPLHRRVDPNYRGLLVAPEITNGILRTKESYFYMGFGSFNRAAGAVLDTATQGSYTTPTGLTRA